jgi:hypothetical protein
MKSIHIPGATPQDETTDVKQEVITENTASALEE